MYGELKGGCKMDITLNKILSFIIGLPYTAAAFLFGIWLCKILIVGILK